MRLLVVFLVACSSGPATTIHTRTRLRASSPPILTPTVTIFGDPNDWLKFADKRWQISPIDWYQSIVLAIRTPAEGGGGADSIPRVVRLERKGKTVTLDVDVATGPNPQGLDFVASPMLVIEVSRWKFHDAKKIVFTFRGQRGVIVDERRPFRP